MRLRIVYDNEAAEGLTADWGFSCHIETGGENVLFDTGADGDILLNNMHRMGVAPSKISKVVLSHVHGDHTGGLSALLGVNDGIRVYAPASFPDRLKESISSRADLVEIREGRRICENVHTTGELGRVVREQSLILGSGAGLFVITGCSHPGLATIFKAASRCGNVSGVLGGLHGSTEYELLEGLDPIAPCHCTAHKDEIARRFPDAFLRVRAGSTVDL